MEATVAALLPATAMLSIWFSGAALAMQCGSSLLLTLPQTDKTNAEGRILEVTVTAPSGAVIEFRTLDGSLIGSINPFGHAGLGTYQIPLGDLPSGEKQLKLEAFSIERKNGNLPLSFCLEAFRLRDE